MQNKLFYKVKVPVGDWSDDGHGKCEWFIFATNKSVEDLREAFFTAKEKPEFKGLAPDQLYADGRMTPDQARQLADLGWEIQLPSDGDEPDYWDTDLQYFAEYIMWFCRQGDPELEWELIDDNIPTLTFYGYDENDRHIGHMGYELFPY